MAPAEKDRWGHLGKKHKQELRMLPMSLFVGFHGVPYAPLKGGKNLVPDTCFSFNFFTSTVVTMAGVTLISHLVTSLFTL